MQFLKCENCSAIYLEKDVDYHVVSNKGYQDYVVYKCSDCCHSSDSFEHLDEDEVVEHYNEILKELNQLKGAS